MDIDSILEMSIRLIRIKFKIEFVKANVPHFISPAWILEGDALLMSDITSKASAINRITFSAHSFEVGSAKNILNYREAVILQMFMTNGVVGIHLKHCRHVRHFKNP